MSNSIIKQDDDIRTFPKISTAYDYKFEHESGFVDIIAGQDIVDKTGVKTWAEFFKTPGALPQTGKYTVKQVKENSTPKPIWIQTYYQIEDEGDNTRYLPAPQQHYYTETEKGNMLNDRVLQSIEKSSEQTIDTFRMELMSKNEQISQMQREIQELLQSESEKMREIRDKYADVVRERDRFEDKLTYLEQSAKFEKSILEDEIARLKRILKKKVQEIKALEGEVDTAQEEFNALGDKVNTTTTITDLLKEFAPLLVQTFANKNGNGQAPMQYQAPQQQAPNPANLQMDYAPVQVKDDNNQEAGQ